MRSTSDRRREIVTARLGVENGLKMRLARSREVLLTSVASRGGWCRADGENYHRRITRLVVAKEMIYRLSKYRKTTRVFSAKGVNKRAPAGGEQKCSGKTTKTRPTAFCGS